MRRLFGVGNSQGYDFIKPGNVPFETDVEASRYWPPFRPVDYIAAAPLARGTAGYQGVPEQDVYDMIDDIKSRFLIDEDSSPHRPLDGWRRHPLAWPDAPGYVGSNCSRLSRTA